MDHHPPPREVDLFMVYKDYWASYYGSPKLSLNKNMGPPKGETGKMSEPLGTLNIQQSKVMAPYPNTREGTFLKLFLYLLQIVSISLKAVPKCLKYFYLIYSQMEYRELTGLQTSGQSYFLVGYYSLI